MYGPGLEDYTRVRDYKVFLLQSGDFLLTLFVLAVAWQLSPSNISFCHARAQWMFGSRLV